MIIDKNPIEMEAMQLFKEHKNDEGTKLQDKFISDLCKFIADGNSHCPCPEPCKYHGKCVECVSLHRGHADHLPVCLQPMVDERLKMLAGLVNHTF